MLVLIGALAGGAIGVVLTWAARLTGVGREVAAHDRDVAALDESLAAWISDATVKLHRDVTATTESMQPGNLHWSSHHALQVALVKEAALEAYRNEEMRVRRQTAELYGREGKAHDVYRSLRRCDRRDIESPRRAVSILDAWAAPVTRHRSSEADAPYPVNDPRARTLEATADYLAENPKTLT